MKATFELENITLTVEEKDGLTIEEIVIAIKAMLRAMNYHNRISVEEKCQKV